MAKTGAERQNKHREIHRQKSDRMTSFWLTPEADKALTKLSQVYSIEKEKVVNRLLRREAANILGGLELNSKIWDE